MFRGAKKPAQTGCHRGELMIYQGQYIAVEEKFNIAWLTFNNTKARINKLDYNTLEDLSNAIAALKTCKDIIGVYFDSAKDDFIIGADVTSFLRYFKLPDDELLLFLHRANSIFNTIEDLPVPTIAGIHGHALGGGFEICLAMDYRLMEKTAKVGFPEVKLGIFPGFGGTVRFSRLVGIDNALEWICNGIIHTAEAALQVGAVDSFVKMEDMQTCATKIFQQCHQNKLAWKEKRQRKKDALPIGTIESMMAFESAKALIASKGGSHYPAPMSALKTIQNHMHLERDAALSIEAKFFIKIAKTSVTSHLVNVFLSDQRIKKKARKIATEVSAVQRAAVVGAGIMGGGIAYQAACEDIYMVLKDINIEGLDKGMEEIHALLEKQVARKKFDISKMAKVLSHVAPTLHYTDFKSVNIVVEAVVENEKIKNTVLADIEKAVLPGTVICSNTSTLSITQLAHSLKAPELFCGMHFFNPVHRMPLVEVIRGKKSNNTAIATAVAYAHQMGKTPIVVNDCPGFFVNRVLCPYFINFASLVNEGVSFIAIDKIMEKFGWPMGPAYLLDVIGLDTALHVEGIMARGFPDRMMVVESIANKLVKQKRLGQKNAAGFYCYDVGKKGKLGKKRDENVMPLLYSGTARDDVDAETIIRRMMIPMALEATRCLEENIVANPMEADIALIYGLGFPPFLGGIFKYMDAMGLDNLVAFADQLASISPLYKVTEQLRTLAEKKTTIYAHY